MKSRILFLLFTLVASLPSYSLDMIIKSAKITTFSEEQFSVIAIDDGKILGLSNDVASFESQISKSTQVIDAGGRRLIPGMNDSHTHVVRGGRFFNLETRWEGLSSLADAIARIEQQAKRTPAGHWVRVIGGWSPYQFKEKRMPTPEELTRAAPNTPVFVLHLYSGGVLNKKGLEVLGINKASQAPKGSRYERDENGNPTGRLIADPNPMILYKTIAALPHMTKEEQVNSSRLFYRKLLSLGVTSVVDAGGGGHSFPENYRASQALAITGELPIRVSQYLFPQKPKDELNTFISWMDEHRVNANLHAKLNNGLVVEGGGELLVWSASDYENFTSHRPDIHETAEKDLEQVVRLHLLNNWPFRIHATYDETVQRMLTVLEDINEKQPLNKVRWFFDHGETFSDDSLKRIKALGGAIAVQGRMAFAGEDFAKRYGEAATRRSPPIKKMLELGIPVGMGTDGTRVASYNPWATYYWLVTGKTVGGFQLYDKSNIIDRLTALELFTSGSAYISGEENIKGRIEKGMYADLAILNHDILTVDSSRLLNTSSVMTIVDGQVRYADSETFPEYSIPAPSAIPAWSPVNYD